MANQPRPLKETARMGDDIYERAIRAHVEAEHFGKIVAIDVDTGDYEIGEDVLAAGRALRARVRPDADVYFIRVGHRAVYRLMRQRVA